MSRGCRCLLLFVACAPLALGACREQPTPSPQAPSPSASASATTSDSSATAGPSAPAAETDGGEYDGPWLGAIVHHVAVWSEMDYPEKGDHGEKNHVIRVGGLRYGEKVPVIPEVHKKPNCPEGWYELLAGGFVCGKFATLDMNHPKFKQVRPPDLVGPLPYAYGINLINGTPLYKQVPSHEQRLKFEPWLNRHKAKSDTDVTSGATPVAAPPASSASSLIDGGTPDPSASSDQPWWERDMPDGGPPDITLEDLEETEGPLARRMVKGFFLSLDHQFPANGVMWWKTVTGLVAPFDRIFIPKPPSNFHGVWLGKDDATFPTTDAAARRIDKLPVGFVLFGHSRKYSIDAHKHATPVEGSILNRFQAVGLTGNTVATPQGWFWETDEGWYMRAVDGTKTEPGRTPEPLGEHEKWIDVNQKRQTLVAFEGTTPVYATLFSSGRNEHETPIGSFRIREKIIAATMDGDADIAADGPYSIEDVPYIEYFNGSYALHGAFWHASFGQVKSHGCVNLAPWDAKGLFGWTDPPLPEGWHAVVATKDHPGTRVVVHERGEGTCKGPKLDVCEHGPQRD